MKHSLLPVLLAAGLLTSCSSAYKATQTPDDVYYSPARSVAMREDRVSNDGYYTANNYYDDRYLSMKVRNHALWNSLDDYSYWYDSRYNFYNRFTYYNPATLSYDWVYGGNPYLYNYSSFYITMSGYGCGGWYNPGYVVAFYKNPGINGTTSGSNITAYRNKNYNTINYPTINSKPTINQQGNSSFGSLVRKTFSPAPSANNSANNSSWSNPVRAVNPSTPSSSSAGGRSGGATSTGSSTGTGRGGRGN